MSALTHSWWLIVFPTGAVYISSIHPEIWLAVAPSQREFGFFFFPPPGPCFPEAAGCGAHTAMNPVNATTLYVSASRAVLQCDPRQPHTFADMYTLLPFFRQSLACLVCGKHHETRFLILLHSSFIVLIVFVPPHRFRYGFNFECFITLTIHAEWSVCGCAVCRALRRGLP